MRRIGWMVSVIAAVAGLGLLAPVAAREAASPAATNETSTTAEGPPVYVGKAFVFEADLERGVELGWCSADTPRQELLDAVEQTLRDRLHRSAKFVEAEVRREEDDRFTVTFVGQQSRGFEDLLTRGLTAAGRFAYRVVASGAERGDCGSAATPEASDCRDLAALDWWTGSEERPGSGGEDRPPLLVEAAPRHLLHAGNTEKLEIIGFADGRVALQVRLDDRGWGDLRSFLDRVGDRELALTIDDAVVRRGIEPSSLERVLLIDGGFRLDDLRPLILAFAGEPLPAPLRFVGTTERELPNVKWRDSPSAID